MKTKQKRVAPFIAVTILWLLLIPTAVMLCTKLVGWPLDLTLLILLPILAVWIPASYPLAILGNNLHESGRDVRFSLRALVRFALLGVIAVSLSATAMVAYALYRSGAYWGIVVCVGLVTLFIPLTIRVLRGAIHEITRST